MSKARVDYLPREIIANRLLQSLDDESKVAILADEQMLDDLINSLRNWLAYGHLGLENRRRVTTLLEDLKRLHQLVFSKVAEVTEGDS